VNEIATRPPSRDELAVLADQARAVVDTEFVPRGLRGNLPAVYACVLAGRELGLGPMESLRKLHMIDGRPSMSAEGMVGLARRAGHSIDGDIGPDSATVKGTRADTGDTMTVTWTLEMAKAAGLVGKDNWKRYPQAMLWARAASQLCRMLFPDVVTSVGHTPDELELSPEDRVVDALESLPAPGDPADVIETPDPEPVPEPEPEVEADPASVIEPTVLEANAREGDDPYGVEADADHEVERLANEYEQIVAEDGEQASFVAPAGAYREDK